MRYNSRITTIHTHISKNTQLLVYEIVEGGKDFGPWKHAH